MISRFEDISIAASDGDVGRIEKVVIHVANRDNLCAWNGGQAFHEGIAHAASATDEADIDGFVFRKALGAGGIASESHSCSAKAEEFHRFAAGH